MDFKTNSFLSFSVGPGIFIVAASYAGCDRGLVVALFTIAMGIMGTFYPGMKVNSLDLSPNYAGSLMALTNGIGAITGIVAPYVVGLMTPEVSGYSPGQSLDNILIPFLPFPPSRVLLASGAWSSGWPLPSSWSPPWYTRCGPLARRSPGTSPI